MPSIDEKTKFLLNGMTIGEINKLCYKLFKVCDKADRLMMVSVTRAR